MSLQIRTDDRPINRVLTPAQLEKQRQDVDNNFIVEQHIKSHTDGHVHLGELAPSRDPDDNGRLTTMATKDQMESDPEAARVRHARNAPVIPVWYFEDEEGETHWFLNYDDAKMAQAGMICFDVEYGTGCLARQADTSVPHCTPLTGPSCGRRTHVS
jgi:hypothetical protein